MEWRGWHGRVLLFLALFPGGGKATQGRDKANPSIPLVARVVVCYRPSMDAFGLSSARVSLRGRRCPSQWCSHKLNPRVITNTKIM